MPSPHGCGCQSNDIHRTGAKGLFCPKIFDKTKGMLPAQQRFWPDPQPLVERMGHDFFRQLPESPGIYMMRGKSESVLYVGKAKNLRHRLSSYRRANPERMPRRIVRLVHLVENIAWEICVDELSALRREAELLLALKPRFNRAGVWKGPKKYLVWRCTAQGLELAIMESPEEGWNQAGNFGGEIIYIHRALVRILWNQLHPDKGLTGMPAGWFSGKHSKHVLIRHRESDRVTDASFYISQLVQGNVESFAAWITPSVHAFANQCLEDDTTFVTEHFTKT